jgi:hypothetical protein
MKADCIPAPLQVIAWLSIAMGVLMALSSVMGLLAFAAMPVDMSDLSAVLGSMEGMDAVMNMVLGWLKYFGLLAAAVHLAIAILVLWSGIDLLRLRAWARTANEIFCWLTLILLALCAVFWGWLWLSLPIAQAQNVLGFDPAAMRTVAIVMMTVVLAVLAIPTIAVLRYLRSPQVRAAISGHRP